MQKIRVITATSLFDGHDASINIMRRLIQANGAEVVHLGHNRSVLEVAHAAIQEDAHAIAMSSYQGGHMEYFMYLREMCNSLGRSDIQIFGGGGGVIIPAEVKALAEKKAALIYTPEDGRTKGLEGIISDLVSRAGQVDTHKWDVTLEEKLICKELSEDRFFPFARALTLLEAKKENTLSPTLQKKLNEIKLQVKNPEKEKQSLVLGITGTGGAGKSSLTDELILRFLREFPEKKICIFSIDPSKKKTGGALLGDRIRMNAIVHKNVFMRSFATRGSRGELSDVISDAIALARHAGFDLILVETSGIGQADTGILDISNFSLYVMTSEYGASSQLEKIDMLDFADAIAINKFDRRASEDAFRDVKTTLRRSRFQGRHVNDNEYPLFGTSASQFNDDGVNALYRHLTKILEQKAGYQDWKPRLELQMSQITTKAQPIIPQNRTAYMAEIAGTVRGYHTKTKSLVKVTKDFEALEGTLQLNVGASTKEDLEKLKTQIADKIPSDLLKIAKDWKNKKDQFEVQDEYQFKVRDKTITVSTKVETLSGIKIPRVCLPNLNSLANIVQFLRAENVPGEFPYTAGVFPFKRTDEEPRRQFAGEGGPSRTNKRFHFLSTNDPAKRLSTAFDSVTLYGEDPASRPDIYGKVGESGVSIATLDDAKELYKGFDLCDPNTSVSMTINGPAPIILAFYFNAALDQQIEKKKKELGRDLNTAELESLKKYTFQNLRGTVQADILKEDQAQNTCIFSIDFALKMMGDIQEYFIHNQVRNYYSVSISGYHIAEAGANPISQLAFTLANGFTYIEYYLSRGMNIDDFAPNLSFFFSNGMDPEYSVIGRVARRIWAVTLKEKYGANERSQKLKYHIQTSGRSLHAQEIDFNDIRTTLEALYAVADNCNSLHTNSYDEAITTPSEESVRRSVAIQLILNREFGMLRNENFLQGSYFVDWLTDAVEEAVLQEFERISSRGGVLGSMETQYQRSKIQEESLHYERRKDSGAYPVIGVNTFVNPKQAEIFQKQEIVLARASYEEKNDQITRLQKVHESHKKEIDASLKKLQQTALEGKNIFTELLNTTRVASLGQISNALYQVGGKYRRNL